MRNYYFPDWTPVGEIPEQKEDPKDLGILPGVH